MAIVSRLLRAALLAGACGLCPLGAAAQYSGCILDNCADKKPLPPPNGDQDGGDRGSASPGSSGS
ncbi:MAG: hypothetical protein P4L68_06455, partial [Methylovirgula sp.]|nr:hypothetical protein [Methylovirgula sp.]